jgi:hypothetical protein
MGLREDMSEQPQDPSLRLLFSFHENFRDDHCCCVGALQDHQPCEPVINDWLANYKDRTLSTVIKKMNYKAATLYNQPFYIFKILMIGTRNSSKELLLSRYMDGVVRTDRSYGDYKFKTILLERKLIKLQIWNTVQCESIFNHSSNITQGRHYRNIDGLSSFSLSLTDHLCLSVSVVP